jgi:hypothetical protein
MPQLLVDFITSLDGYGAAEGWAGFWGLQGPEYLAWLEDQPEADYTVLMGPTPTGSCPGSGRGGRGRDRGPGWSVEGRLLLQPLGAALVAEHQAPQ